MIKKLKIRHEGLSNYKFRFERMLMQRHLQVNMFRLISSTELRFKFLKDPMFVDSLFLKTPERIEALGYVLLIALFIYMTLEERIRTAVQQQNIRLQPVRGWHTRKPTAKQVILMLEHIVTIYWFDWEDETWKKQMQQNEQAQQLFDLLMVNPYDNSV